MSCASAAPASGWASLRDLPAPAGDAGLHVGDVDAALERIAGMSGPGSQAIRREAIAGLFGRATSAEQAFLRALLSGGIRQGALAGVMADAVAAATGIPRAAVDRATTLRGDPRAVAEVALREGAAGLAAFRLELGRPVGPMLASPAASLEEALTRVGEGAVDWKLDGARIQVHRDGDEVAIFSRSLDDLTARLPEVAAAARGLPVQRVVLDGEAIALRADGRPESFQVTSSRIASGAPGIAPVLFDVLHLDGEDLLDAPLARRARRARRRGAAEALRVPRVITGDPAVAQAHFDAALAAGHEGVVVKALDAPYAAGRRGAGWLKVKPRHTLDLVVLAAEWGHGRRRGWLSNLHLGARAERRRRVRDARQDLQGPDRRDARLADRAPAGARGASSAGSSSRSAPSSSSRSPSTASRSRRGTPAASPCASPASCGTARTRTRSRPTTSPPSSR